MFDLKWQKRGESYHLVDQFDYTRAIVWRERKPPSGTWWAVGLLGHSSPYSPIEKTGSNRRKLMAELKAIERQLNA